MPNMPPRNTSTFRRSSPISETVIPRTAAIRMLFFPAICMKGSRISAPMDAGTPMMKPTI